RYSPASTPTTGFSSPYDLQSAAYVNLKVPYSTITSSTGILFDNVGVYSGTTFYGAEIGNESLDEYFNLFDGQAYSISATNSNLRSVNNVFQNSKRYTIVICGPKCATYTVGGTAIRETINTTMNANLNLNAIGSNSSSTSYANRFWNCYTAVEAYNVYRINIERAIFRSLQTTSGGTGYLPGNTGVYINTNRFQYNLRFNEFANICNAINIPIVAGTYNVGAGVQTGIYAAQLVLNNNYFGANHALTGNPAGKYMSQAISVTSPNNTTWQFATTTGLFIQNNTMYRPYRGIQVSGLAGYSCTINNNFINIVDDNLFYSQQRGIEVTSTQNKAVVSTNTLSSTNITNTLTSLCYFGANTGTNSPRVTCNDLSNSFKAFEFNATNKGTYWRGNLMNTHAQGLTLSNSATISPQGSSGQPQDNAWNGTWTSGTNFGTWVTSASTATDSPIWYKSSLALPTNSGNVVPTAWYSAPGTMTLTTGLYDCSGGGGQRMASQNNYYEENGNFSSSYKGNNTFVNDGEYVNGTSLYRFIYANPSVKNNNAAYSSFYNSKLNTSMDQFVQIEKALYEQQLGQALSLNSAVTASNVIEENYKSFYTLHAKYQLGNFATADSNALVALANFCPGLDGEVVYQARALYNVIFKTVITFNESCDPEVKDNSRKTNVNKINSENNWTIELYPNPANTFINIVNSREKDQLKVTIADISGKILFVKQVITSNFICNLDLDLLPGAYFVTITNDKNNSTTKKLIITK
ncbi:MAG: T9SS type A sorting domain-containing protein, partial [Bacteroidota bacterium]|nr:T9SS type A sorting domain-containing protein [Bacteroidota bacterium]